MDRKETAVYCKHNGYNCCQAVLKAYSDILDLDEGTLNALGAGFCAGMGNMKATCGAVIGANMVLGLVNKSGRPTLPLSRMLISRFEEKCGATTCGDLKGVTTGKLLCSCDDCIGNAIDALEEILSLFS